jgi:hypothetical protein
MYDLYEYISECAVATAFLNVRYRSSCSAALTVRPTFVERAILRKRSFPLPLLSPHLASLHPSCCPTLKSLPSSVKTRFEASNPSRTYLAVRPR